MPATPSNLPLGLALALIAGALGCSHSQSAPTPVAGTTSQVSAASKAASMTQKPWTNAASTPSPPSVADLTAPLDVAMVLCSSALNLAPCGVVTSGISDVTTCFAGCQTQIETVVALTIQRAAQKCAAAPPPEAGPRACELSFPPTAALDLEVAGRTCDQLCQELAGDHAN
jgi:hypothetical protein